MELTKNFPTFDVNSVQAIDNVDDKKNSVEEGPPTVNSLNAYHSPPIATETS